MRRAIIFFLLTISTSLALTIVLMYAYALGWDAGVENYKRSQELQFTLSSMYTFGFQDGKSTFKDCLCLSKEDGSWTNSDGQCWIATGWNPCGSREAE